MGFTILHALIRRIRPGRFAQTGLLILATIMAGTVAQAQRPAAAAQEDDTINVIGRYQRTTVPHVFGTVAVPFGTTPMSARWTRIVTASLNDARLARLTAGAHDMALPQKAAYVQSAINRSVRNLTRDQCVDDGYWAATRESLAKGNGDCVDIAIAKMEALRHLGVSARDIYLTSGRRANGVLEVALLVRGGDQYWLLDVRSDQIVEAGRSGSFIPIVTYGVGMTWAHGVQVSPPRTLSKPPVVAQAPTQPDRNRAYSGLDADTRSAIRSLAPAD